MKIAVINFSGNVGKSVVARHLILPRLSAGAEYIAVESINADEGDADTVKGKEYGAIQEQLLVSENDIVIDVGASNVEDFMKLMKAYSGSHEDFDMFVVPSIKDAKQIRDTIATIQALSSIGVPAKKIKVVFNKLEIDDTVEDSFYPIIAYHDDHKAFSLRKKAVIGYSELYQKLRLYDRTIENLLSDNTDYKAKMIETKDPQERSQLAQLLSMRRLAITANSQLDSAYAALIR